MGIIFKFYKNMLNYNIYGHLFIHSTIMKNIKLHTKQTLRQLRLWPGE